VRPRERPGLQRPALDGKWSKAAWSVVQATTFDSRLRRTPGLVSRRDAERAVRRTERALGFKRAVWCAWAETVGRCGGVRKLTALQLDALDRVAGELVAAEAAALEARRALEGWTDGRSRRRAAAQLRELLEP
jgi:hypothetical protein